MNQKQKNKHLIFLTYKNRKYYIPINPNYEKTIFAKSYMRDFYDLSIWIQILYSNSFTRIASSIGRFRNPNLRNPSDWLKGLDKK